MASNQHSGFAQAVTALFVPGNRGDRFDKAVASGADVVIIDWEDAVGPDDKKEARETTLEWCRTTDTDLSRIAIRVNAPDTSESGDDWEAITRLVLNKPDQVPTVLVAKVESAADLENLHSKGGVSISLGALIESAAGLHAAHEIAAAPGVVRLAFGALDFSLDTGMATTPEVMAYARSTLVIASRVANIPAPLDSPETTISDTEWVYQAALTAKNFGLSGKLCIHPHQLEAVRRGFQPSETDIQWAKTIVGATLGASQVNGTMVDRPVIERAKRILESLEATQ